MWAYAALTLVNGGLANKQKGAWCVLHTTAFNSILRGERTKHFKCNTSAHHFLGSMHTGSVWEPCLLPILEANLFPSFVIASRVLLDDVLSGTVETRKLIWSNMYRVTGIGVGNERTMLLEPFHLYSLQIQPLPLVHSHIPRTSPMVVLYPSSCQLHFTKSPNAHFDFISSTGSFVFKCGHLEDSEMCRKFSEILYKARHSSWNVSSRCVGGTMQLTAVFVAGSEWKKSSPGGVTCGGVLGKQPPSHPTF